MRVYHVIHNELHASYMARQDGGYVVVDAQTRETWVRPTMHEAQNLCDQIVGLHEEPVIEDQ